MGKRIITQRRGRGTSTYRSPSHRYIDRARHRKYDDIEKTSVITGKIVDLLDCPGHSAPLAEVKFADGKRVYMIAPLEVRVNSTISSGSKAIPVTGNTLPLSSIPEGMPIYNIESKPGDGGKFCRSTGSSARVVARIHDKIVVKFQSRKEREFDPNCRATIGIVAGQGRLEKPFVRAGNKFFAMQAKNKLWPRTSGVSMNAVNHPFGSGRGSHAGKPLTPPRFAPPGRNVGAIRARRTGRKKK